MRTTKGLWAKLCLIPALTALGGCGGETPDTAAETERDEIQAILEEASQHDQKGEIQANLEMLLELCKLESPYFSAALDRVIATAESRTEYIRAVMGLVVDTCPQYSQDFADTLKSAMDISQ